MRHRILRSAAVAVVAVAALHPAVSASPAILPPSLFVWAAGQGHTRVLREIDYLDAGRSVWAPDGRRVAVARRGQLLIYNFVTGRRRTLATGANVADAAWSPDGSVIAFSGSTEELGTDIYTIQPASGDVTRLTTHPRAEWEPEWAPSGDLIAFNRGGRTGGIFVMEPSGSNAQRLVGGVNSELDWSPDGETIAFIASHDIWTMRRDGSKITSHTHTFRWEGDLSWSPDGDRLAHSADGRLYLLELESGRKRHIPVDRRMSMSSTDWSPNGRRIAFVGRDDIWTVRPDGTHLRNLTRRLGDGVASPIWSPTGALRLIFERSRLIGTGEVLPTV